MVLDGITELDETMVVGVAKRLGEPAVQAGSHDTQGQLRSMELNLKREMEAFKASQHMQNQRCDAVKVTAEEPSLLQLRAALTRAEDSLKEEMNMIWSAIREVREQTSARMAEENSTQELLWNLQRLVGRVEHLEECAPANRQAATGVRTLTEELSDLQKRMGALTRATEQVTKKQSDISQAMLGDGKSLGSAGQIPLTPSDPLAGALMSGADASLDITSSGSLHARLAELESSFEGEKRARATDAAHVCKLVDKIAARATDGLVPSSQEGLAPSSASPEELRQYADSKCAQVRSELQELRDLVEPMAKDVSRVGKVEEDVRQNTAALDQLDEFLHSAHKSMDKVMEKMALETQTWQATQDRVEFLARQLEEQFAAGAGKVAVATVAASAASDAFAKAPCAPGPRGRGPAAPVSPQREGSVCHSPTKTKPPTRSAASSRSASPRSRRGTDLRACMGGVPGSGQAEQAPYFADPLAVTLPVDEGRSPERAELGCNLRSSLERLNDVLESTLQMNTAKVRAMERGASVPRSQSRPRSVTRERSPEVEHNARLKDLLEDLNSTVERTLHFAANEAERPPAENKRGSACVSRGSSRSRQTSPSRGLCQTAPGQFYAARTPYPGKQAGAVQLPRGHAAPDPYAMEHRLGGAAQHSPQQPPVIRHHPTSSRKASPVPPVQRLQSAVDPGCFPGPQSPGNTTVPSSFTSRAGSQSNTARSSLHSIYGSHVSATPSGSTTAYPASNNITPASTARDSWHGGVDFGSRTPGTPAPAHPQPQPPQLMPRRFVTAKY